MQEIPRALSDFRSRFFAAGSSECKQGVVMDLFDCTAVQVWNPIG